jgi:hypothetical protein
MKDSGGKLDDAVLVLAGKMRSSHEVVDMMDMSLSVNIL